MKTEHATFRKPMLLAALALGGLASVGQAHASAYSYSRAELKNFSVVFGTTPTDLARSRQTITSSSYTGFPNAGDSDVKFGTGIVTDADQAFSGPLANKPSENIFTQAFTPLSSTAGARGDAYTNAGLTQVVDVSESNVVSSSIEQSGSQSARNIGTVEFSVSSTNTVAFNMLAFWGLSTSVDRLGDDATSSASAIFSVKKFDGANYVELYTYNAFNQSCVSGPGSLRPCAISSSSIAGADADGFVTRNSDVFSLDAGEYILNLKLETTGSANTQAVQQVPEPATISLLGAGLVGLAAARRRKTKAGASIETETKA